MPSSLVDSPRLQTAPRADSKQEADPSRRIIQLDFVRGIAILAVMEYHFETVPVANVWARGFEHFFKRTGWMGVDLFFVLSGFLVGGLIIQELLKTGNLRIRRFLLRRMFKIWPAYYCYLLLQICIGKHPLGSFAWQNLLNIQNYAGTSLNHTWSLAVEEHFYLALPLLLLVLYKKARLRRWIIPILGGCCLLVLCGRILSVYGFNDGDPQWKTHARIDSLFFGVILSYLLHAHRTVFDKLVKLRIPLLLLSVGGILFGLHESHATRLMWSIGYSIDYLCLGSLLLLIYGYRGRLTRSLPYRAIAFIGLYSYGIYLWHLSVREPLARVAAHFPVSVRWGGLMLGQYLAALTLGFLMTKAVEFPMLRLRERLVPAGPALPRLNML